MNPNRRRKKRPNYGIRTVEVMRGPNGFGFTISGQQPCILSCIVSNSPADLAGLRAGDFLISVNGVSVSKITHDAIVNLIGNCVGPIKMTVADNYYSDSSDEELDCHRIVNSRKPKYMHKPRARVLKTDLRRTAVETNEKNLQKMRECFPKQVNNEQRNVFVEKGSEEPVIDQNPAHQNGPIEYKAFVGYMGTIEMPKELLPSSSLQTVCTCIKKLRQEKRRATMVLMTILPTCLTLKNASNHILAIYPTNRVVYIGSATDRESRYFGLVTSAVCDRRNENLEVDNDNNWQDSNKKNASADNCVEVSNSCHVFVTDPKIVDHNVHQKKAEKFNIVCTKDAITGNCLEFPISALYIVSLVQSLYKLHNIEKNNENIAPIIANSPQPSASSNSDSGIGYRDDCGNVSDRILVVEFPMHNSVPYLKPLNRPAGIDASNVALEGLDMPLNSAGFELNNVHLQNGILKGELRNGNLKQLNNINSIRGCEILRDEILYHHPFRHTNKVANVEAYNDQKLLDVDYCSSYHERPVDVPDLSPSKKSCESISLHSVENLDFKNSVDNVSVHSSKSMEFSNILNVFKVPFESKKSKRHLKMNSCNNLDKCNDNFEKYKLSPKPFGLSKSTYNSEEIINSDGFDKFGYGSLQDLCSWTEQGQTKRDIAAQSEPDVRNPRRLEDDMSDQNGAKYGSSDGPASWACSFEKLLDDPMGLHVFAEFLKKEFSAENIFFWTACERYKNLPSGSEKAAEAQRIYQQHLSIGAAEAVNVDSHGRQCTEQCLQEPTTDMFNQAQKQIFNLMKFDSYPRFLKSDIYKQCLSGDFQNPPTDTRLLLHPTSTSPTKLKKSVSNAEDRRRKSLLPWHRKNRSKSKDRGESEYTQKHNNLVVESGHINEKSDLHSSGSSLTSLDLATSYQESNKQKKITNKEDLNLLGEKIALCKVLLSNGSTTVVQIKPCETIKDLVSRVLEKRGISYNCFDLYTDKHPKPMDISESASKLAGCEVTVEQRVTFRVDLPNRKTICIKSKYTKKIIDVLRPSLHKYQFNIDHVVVLSANKPIDLHQPVTAINEMRLNVQLKDDIRDEDSRTDNKVHSKRDEMTNKVFEGILQEKANAVTFKPAKSDKESVKSEDWGSEHSSTFIGKFLRRDSGMHEKKKKIVQRSRPGNSDEVNMIVGQIKKPLIAKWKAGANKLNISSIENDEFVEGLTRAQRRLEDQRGTEINFQMPDFLKDKENQQNSNALHKHGELRGETRFYLDPPPSSHSNDPPLLYPSKKSLHSMYENRNIVLPEDQNQKQNNLRVASSSENSSAQSTPTKGLNNTVIENNGEGRPSDPPPLPPKPKIVPTKPQNWGQLNGFGKFKDVKTSSRTQTMFLEERSSSFV